MAILVDPDEHFDAADFDAEIESHGAPALWRKALTCPCVHLERGTPAIGCQYCRDFPGIIWDSGADVRVLAQSRKRNDILDEAGQRIEGMCTIVFPSSVTPGHLDRIDLLAGIMVVNNERLEAGKLDRAGRSSERVRVYPVIEVESCQGIVGVDKVLTQFTPGLDFNINSDGDVGWVNPPADGTQYSLRYTVRPSYVCWSPMSRDEGGTKQPYRCDAQRLDFYRHKSVGEA